jgi:hypothetical protein
LTAHKDRRTALVVFGVIVMLMGVACGLIGFGLVMAPARTLPSSEAGPVGPVPGALLFGSLSVTNIALGFGSVQARRWARALLFVISAYWLAVGIVMIPLVAVVMPRMMASLAAQRPPGPPDVTAAGMISIVAIPGIVLILLSGTLAAFYASRNVRLIVLHTLVVASWITTLLIVGPDEMMGPAMRTLKTSEQIKIGAMMAGIMPWVPLACMVPYLGFMIWTRRHFWSRARAEP